MHLIKNLTITILKIHLCLWTKAFLKTNVRTGDARGRSNNAICNTNMIIVFYSISNYFNLCISFIICMYYDWFSCLFILFIWFTLLVTPQHTTPIEWWIVYEHWFSGIENPTRNYNPITVLSENVIMVHFLICWGGFPNNKTFFEHFIFAWTLHEKES